MKTLDLWQRFASKPGGKWLFSKLVCFKAPYFSSIRPQIAELRPGYCEVRMGKRWRVQNHIGSVHAIAMCNLAELAGGMMTDVTIPATHRWIPKGMTVKYLKVARSDVVAIAKPRAEADWTESEFQVDVAVTDLAGERVFEAVIDMWVTRRPTEKLG